MKVLFHSNQLGIRGTEVALFDYAFHNQALLGNQSAIVYDATNKWNDPLVIEKFREHFPLYAYSDFSEFDEFVGKSGAERAYFMKAGNRDGKVSNQVPSLIHAVFPTAAREYHGSVFAFISEWLARLASKGPIPYVPYMIDLPNHDLDLRDKLNIPKSALVIGSYGGSDSFDISFVPDCIRIVLERRKDIYFLFMNYPRFIDHERAIFLERSADLEFKVRVINSSDAMLHARKRGESFGLACGEFSIRNKPVLTFGGSPERSHIEILGSKALLYDSLRDLYEILMGLDRNALWKNSWDCYSRQFAPGPVMQKFKQVFLDAQV
jgi:hypothetical protein